MDIKIYIILSFIRHRSTNICPSIIYYLLNIHRIAYVPNTTHIVTITLEPSVINQRKATQCGADDINGDNSNPEIVSGTQYVGYSCAAT